jgi:hypothetical protein
MHDHLTAIDVKAYAEDRRQREEKCATAEIQLRQENA